MTFRAALFAVQLGLSEERFAEELAAGKIPPPDGYDEDGPYWLAQTVAHYHHARVSSLLQAFGGKPLAPLPLDEGPDDPAAAMDALRACGFIEEKRRGG